MSRFQPKSFEEARINHKPMRRGRIGSSTDPTRNTRSTVLRVGSSYTHEQLVDVAREWLRSKHPVVLTELTVTGGECADAIGFKFRGQTTLVECKASRSDFLADKKKWFRREPERGMGLHRYFLAPAGLLKADELPAGWGLLEWNGHYVAIRRSSGIFGVRNDNAERGVLVSTLRRLGRRVDVGVSISCYSFNAYEAISGQKSKNKATLSVLEEDVNK